MGLDMMLYAERYTYDESECLSKAPPEILSFYEIDNNRTVRGVTETFDIGYWRKFYPLNEYIESIIDCDDNETTSITREQLNTILNDLLLAYEDEDKLKEIFGDNMFGWDTDSVFYNQLAYSILVFEKAIKLAEDFRWEISYRGDS